jgi:hypothetical protein
MARISERFTDALQFVPELECDRSGRTDPHNLLDAAGIFDRLIDEQEGADPEAIRRSAMEEHGWPPEAAERHAFAWEVVLCLREAHFRRQLASAGLRAGEGWACLGQAVVSINHEWLAAQSRAADQAICAAIHGRRRRAAPSDRRRLRYTDRVRPPWAGSR